MATDVALLHLASVTTLRFYTWNPPTVSLGWFQECGDDIPKYRALGYGVIRRPTGGGAVAHHHEVTYAFVASTLHPAFDGLDTKQTYDVIHAPIVDALSSLGVDVHSPSEAPPPQGGAHGPRLCFDRTASVDLVCNGRKIVGSAQRRVTNRVLQHGSIILRTNPIQPDTGSLDEALGASPSVEDLVCALTSGFRRFFGASIVDGLSPAESALIEELKPSFRLP